MRKIVRLAAAAALLSATSVSLAWAEMGGMAGSSGQEIQIVMNPGQGLPMDVGGKRIVGVYTQENGTCGLALVFAESEMGGMANGGTDAPHGIRVTGNVQPGKSLRVDGELNRAAEFFCGPDGRKMNARIYTREGYTNAAAGGKKS
jgi:hypothetical protein